MTPSQGSPWDATSEPRSGFDFTSSSDSLKHVSYPTDSPRTKMRFRLGIRQQLCAVILTSNLLALMVLAVSTWYMSVHHLNDAKSQTLTVTANLKATQVAQQISSFRASIQQISTWQVLQGFMQDFNNGNYSEELYDSIKNNLEYTLSDGFENAVLLQAAVFPRANTADQGSRALAYLTGSGVIGMIALPTKYENGTSVLLGDEGPGYPPELYPNLTYGNPSNGIHDAFYEGKTLDNNTTLLLGPIFLHTNSSLISLTVPINNNTSRSDILGWLTVVLDAKALYDVVESRVGLGQSGEVIIVGPGGRPDNLFAENVSGRTDTQNANVPVQFVLPPTSNRHPTRAKDPYLPFPMKAYPAILRAWSDMNGQLNNAGGLMWTNNEEGRMISLGYARVSSDVVDWVLVFGQAHSEVVGPINELRRAVLASIFGVVGAIMIFTFPFAHYAVKPIHALRTATENSVNTYEAYDPSVRSDTTNKDTFDDDNLLREKEHGQTRTQRSQKKKKFVRPIREFKIPERVPERNHLVYDELTDLTTTFNEMADELSVQYHRLEDRVRLRTTELEHSKNAAEAANESKTLFIANVSHELRTPLNGIIGMCAVAMQEDDLPSVRQSLKIMYKSSDLLLHLLNDLLTFSRSSIGQNFTIEEDTFRLVDIGSQLVSIFEKQAAESNVSFRVVFIGSEPKSTGDIDPEAQEDAIIARHDMTGAMQRMKTNVLARGPADLGPLRDVGLRGDKNRILQILMNLVSNALKFTPVNGTVELRIKYKGFIEPEAMPIVQCSKGKDVPQIALSKAFQRVSSEKIQPKSSLRGLMFDFEVEDTGPGIPEHLQQEIFKPFVQGDLALSKKHGGVGLGLAICSQLAGMMGGFLAVRSTVDIGSTFTFSVPLRYTKEVVPSITDSLARPKAGSINSSVQFDTFSTRSGIVREVRSLKSRQTSLHSNIQDRDTQLDIPRLVGFSQPYLVDANKSSEDIASEVTYTPQRRQSIPSSASRLAPILSVTTPEEQDNHTEVMLQRKDSPQKPLHRKSSLVTSTQSPSCPFKILVAEDNPVNQQVILKLLRLEKVIDLTLAVDGEEAVQKIQESLSASESEHGKASSFQLILMDIQMPKMDGIAATKKIREMGYVGPILALTAFDHETNRAACQDAGMNGFLPKPIKRTALRKVLDEYKSADKVDAEATLD